MTKILIITGDFPPIVGGISDYSFGLAKGLAANKHEVTVLAIYYRALKDKIQPSVEFNFIPIFASRILPIKLIQILYVLQKHLRGLKIDQLISTIWFPCGIAAFLLKPFFRFRSILCIHGADVLRANLKFKAKPVIRLIARTADFVICNSRFTKNLALEMLTLPENHVHVVNPGFNPQKYQSLEIPQHSEHRLIENLESLCQNKMVLLTVARLTKSKGHQQVIEALPFLLKKYPDLVYVIVGMSPPQNSTKPLLLDLISSLNLTQAVHIFDKISENFIKRAFEFSTIFVMLSQEIPEGGYCEGFGIVFLEAGYFAKPVIGSHTGGIADAIADGRSGFLVDPLDRENLIAKIDLLIQNSDLAHEMGNAGQKRVLDHFLWEKIVARHNHLFS